MTAMDLPTAGTRARGLGVHLFRRAEVEALAGQPDLPSLARALARSGKLTDPIAEPVTTDSIEAAIRRTALRRLRALAAWTGAQAALDVLFADRDRKSVRAMLRGAVQSAPASARLSGLLPTPRLPERALAELAREPTAATVAARLVVLGHPDADALVALSTRAQPVLFDLELALVRGFAARSLAAARAGDANLVRYVGDRIDACNLELALSLTAGPREIDPATCFVAGGRRLSKDSFVAACRAEPPDRALAILSATPLATLVAESHGRASRVDRVALSLALADQRLTARLDPLGSAPLVLFLLRLEAQSLDLLRVTSAVALGAPASLILPELVTPWS